MSADNMNNKISNNHSQDVESLALIALQVENLLHFILQAINQAGFQGKEFLEKSELMLVSVTSNFSSENFKGLMNILSQLYKDFQDTELYLSLITLRKMCTQDQVENYANPNQKINILPQEKSPITMMFAIHLVENIKQYLHFTRDNEEVNMMSNNDLLVGLQDTFRFSLNKTLFETFHLPSSRV